MAVRSQDDESLYEEAKDRTYAADENYVVHENNVMVADAILKRNPSFAKAHELKALALRHAAMITTRENDPELLNKAEKEIDQALAMKPDDPTFLIEKAWILFEKSRYNEAQDQLNRAISFQPTLAAPYILKTRIYYDQKNEAEVDNMLAKI